MNKVSIKPLSVNKAWQGRRYKTDDYIVYERSVLLLLPKITIPDGKLLLRLEFGFSSKASDIDNPVKMFQDCLQKKYGFNDSRIRLLIVAGVDVKKGDEYIKFAIESAGDLAA
jgi:Holliday junction resolvase RusA-like endonuclease